MMTPSKFLATTAFTLSMIAAGGFAAYAQSDATTSDDTTATASASAAPAQDGQAKAGKGERHHRKGGCHGKHDHHGKGERHGARGERFGRHGGGEMMRALFAKVDANGDGSVTQAEIDTYRAGKLAEVDTSGDGALSIEEFDTLYREMTRLQMVRAFQRLDTDGDGVISPAEMDARFGHIVQRMDRNGDGALSIQDRGNPE